MERRSKKTIQEDREQLKLLIKKENKTVDDIFEWKNHPYSTDNKLCTVETYNSEVLGQLNWNVKEADVLYSLLGIYTIGLAAYYPEDFESVRARRKQPTKD